MAEVEDYASIARFDPEGDFTRLFELIRTAYSTKNGILESGNDLEDYLLADLLEAGKMSIRLEQTATYLSWVTMVRVTVVNGSTGYSERVFYRPDGAVLVRVIDTVIRS
jgi:hypothetical protein